MEKVQIKKKTAAAVRGETVISVMDRIERKRQIRALSVTSLLVRAGLTVASVLVLVSAAVYFVSLLKTMPGSFVVSAENNRDSDCRISLSETSAFLNPTVKLTAGAIEGMDNITYDWLPEDLESQDGGHNGENYLAYSFYLKNEGQTALTYEGKIVIDEATRGIEEAVRVMVIQNGARTICASPRSGTELPEPGTVPFASSTVAFVSETDIEAEQMDRYTVVVWLEGEDPECVDRVKGGKMSLRMNFRVLDDEPAETQEDIT